MSKLVERIKEARDNLNAGLKVLAKYEARLGLCENAEPKKKPGRARKALIALTLAATLAAAGVVYNEPIRDFADKAYRRVSEFVYKNGGGRENANTSTYGRE